MGSTGIEGGLEGGQPGGATVLPAPPPPPLEDTEFARQVAAMDRTAQAVLGAVPVTYQTRTGVIVSIRGIFDASYHLATTGSSDDPGVEVVVPAVFLQLADLPADPLLDDPTLNIGGTVYRVFERRSADFGSIVLALRQVR
jgi:hypothetical protein